MTRNDEFPSTRGMTDAEVESRQSASQRVTRKPKQTVVVRYALHMLPRKWHPKGTVVAGGRVQVALNDEVPDGE